MDLLAESAGGTGKSGFNILLAGGYGSSGSQLYGYVAMLASVDEKSKQQMYYAKFTSTSVSASTTASSAYVSVRCLMD